MGSDVDLRAEACKRWHAAALLTRTTQQTLDVYYGNTESPRILPRPVRLSQTTTPVTPAANTSIVTIQNIFV